MSRLGREGRLMDPNLGGRPGGRGLKSPAGVAGGAPSSPPPTGEGMVCRWWAPSGGGEGTRLGVGESLEIRRGGQRSLTFCNRQDTWEIAFVVRQVPAGFMGAGERDPVSELGGFRCPSSHPPP